MLMSVDGKISTGDIDERDVDKDFPKIAGIKEGLQQYYELEKQTDIYSLNSGRVQAKVGVNERSGEIERIPVNFIIIDNKPHLELSGVNYFLKRGKKLYLVTTNKNHPAFSVKDDNIEVIYFEKEIDFENLLEQLKERGCDRLTIQTGGNLNAEFVRRGLVDHISIVVAPALIGGKDTSSLIDGPSLRTENDLMNIKPLKLVEVTKLENSYLHLKYDVLNYP